MQSFVPPAMIAASVQAALAEDVGSGDLTAQLIPEEAVGSATVVAREEMCLCGTGWFDAVFASLDSRVHVEWSFVDGDWVRANSVVCALAGPARALLTGERTALNFLQMLSGTATTTHRYAQ